MFGSASWFMAQPPAQSVAIAATSALAGASVTLAFAGMEHLLYAVFYGSQNDRRGYRNDPAKQKQTYAQLNDLVLDASFVAVVSSSPQIVMTTASVHGLWPTYTRRFRSPAHGSTRSFVGASRALGNQIPFAARNSARLCGLQPSNSP